jgi:hypothetical protein
LCTKLKGKMVIPNLLLCCDSEISAVLVTGTSLNGIGFETARVIAKHVNLLIMTGENSDGLNPLLRFSFNDIHFMLDAQTETRRGNYQERCAVGQHPVPHLRPFIACRRPQGCRRGQCVPNAVACMFCNLASPRML